MKQLGLIQTSRQWKIFLPTTYNTNVLRAAAHSVSSPQSSTLLAVKLWVMITNLFGTMIIQILHYITVAISGCLIQCSELWFNREI